MIRPGSSSLATRGVAPAMPVSLATRGAVWAARPRGDLTIFEARIDFDQGRMRPTASPATGGAHAMVLGCDTPGMTGHFAPGDYVIAEQDVDLTGMDLIRADLVLRTPADVPDGWAWRASITVDDLVFARALGRPGRTRALADMAANVSKLSGVHKVGFRLDLIEV